MFVSAIDANSPALRIKVDPSVISQTVVDRLIYTLTQDKEIINGYVIKDETPRLSGRSVATYWRNLQMGLGHTTRAYVYGNFSINMKGLLLKVFHAAIPNFKTLYDAGAISTIEICQTMSWRRW